MHTLHAGSHLCTRLHCCTHGPVHNCNGIFATQVHSTLAHTRCLYMNMYVAYNKNDGTRTHKHCDMHMHSIPFIKLLLCIFVLATDLMHKLCALLHVSSPFDNYFLCMLSSHIQYTLMLSRDPDKRDSIEGR